MNKLYIFSLLIGLQLSLNGIKAQNNSQPRSAPPAGFIENKGQLTGADKKPVNNVFYKYSTKGFHAYITDKGLSYSFIVPQVDNKNRSLSSSTNSEVITYNWSRTDIEFENTTINPSQIIAESSSAELYNFYTAAHPEGISNVKKYEQVTIKNLYKGIDWVIYVKDDPGHSGLKYDFVIHPGADISLIGLNIKGADKIILGNDEKSFTIKTKYGDISEGPLYCYYEQSKQPVELKYKLDGSTIILKGSRENMNETLVVDPILNWGTYFGGEDSEHPYSITTQKDGTLYITGDATDAGTDMTTYDPAGGAWFQGTMVSIVDIFILKFDKNGVLKWATYYGGNDDEEGGSICLDKNENIYVVGRTTSSNFPTLDPLGGAYYKSALTAGKPGNRGDPYIIKFNSAGVRIWATYLNVGTNDVDAFKVVCNSAGHVFMSTYNGTTVAPPYTDPGGGAYYSTTGNALIFEFDQNCNLIWCTAFPNISYIYDMVFDKTNNLYITGMAGGNAIPLVDQGGGAWYEATSASSYKLFITKFNPSRTITWSTFYNGNNQDYGEALAVDSCNNVYLLAGTKSTNFSTLDPGSGGYYQSSNGGKFDLFLLKFNSSGQRQWATYFGGANDENYFAPAAIKSFSSLCNMIYHNGYIFFGGNAVDFSGVGNGIPLMNPGGGSYYVNTVTTNLSAFGVQMDVSGKLIWSSYIGAPDRQNFLVNCAADTSGQIYMVNGAYGNGALTLNNGYPGSYYQATKSGIDGSYQDVFIHRFNPIVPSLTATPTPVTCGGGSDGVAVTSISNIIAPYSYSWSNASTGSGISGVTANTYTVSVTDAACRTITTTVTITQPPLIIFSASQNSAALCGSANGIALATAATGGAGSFNYTWSSGASGLTANGLIGGSYTVTATDANSCTKTATVTIGTSTSLLFNGYNKIDPKCYGGNNGSAKVIISSGVSPFNYTWSTATTGSSATDTIPITNIIAGTYTVTVNDVNNCSATTTVTVTQPTQLVPVVFSVTDATCGNNDGSVDLLIGGGTWPLSFNWSNGFTGTTSSIPPGNPLTNVYGGNYGVTVTDANGCTATTAASVNNTGGATINSVGSTSITCNGNNTGSVNVNASGSSLTYLWTGGYIGATVSNLTAGNYFVTVTDGSGCNAFSNVQITEPTAITITSPTINDATCGINNGSASVSASGGTGSLIYLWSNSATGQTINGVGSGTYTLSVTDANNCTKTTSALINNSPSAVIDSVKITNLTCNLSGNGNAIAYATGGSGILTYTWSNGTSGKTTNNQQQGTYIISVTDAGGCLTQSNVVITQPTAITTNTTSITNATCGSNNGEAIVQANGGTGPSYNYSWSTSFSSTGAFGSSLNNVSAGSYTVTVTDVNLCTNTLSVNIGNIGGASFANSTITNANCKNQTGSATVNITGGVSGNYTYVWSNGASSITSSTSHFTTSLPATTYTVTVTDGVCTATTTITITEPSSVFTSTVTSANGTCTTGGTATVNISGGNSGSYTYVWSGGITSITNSSTQQFGNLTSGNYFITVTDSKGCTTTSVATVTVPGSITASLNTKQDVNCFGQNTGSAGVTTSVGSAPYTYIWSNGFISVTTNLNSQISNLTSQIYSVTVTDNNGCTSVLSINITEPSVLNAVPTTTDATCGNNNGSISLAVSGGTIQYTYTWSNSFSGSTNNNLSANNYSVTVTDNKNCTKIISTTVINTPLPVATATSNTTNITTGNNVILSGSGGSTYMWSPSANLSCNPCQNPTATPTQTTTYTLVVTDINNCMDTTFVTINVTELKDCGGPYLPEAFSPNNDGQNDVLYLRGTNISNIELLIFDRWGNKIFETTNPSNGWNGIYHSQLMDTGVYAYYLKATCLKTGNKIDQRGNITLIR